MKRKAAYFAIKEIWSPIKFERKELTPDFDGKLAIENRYAFTNTAQCSFSWRLEHFSPLVPVSKTVTGIYRKAAAPDIKPFSKGILKLELPKDWNHYDVLYVTARDPFDKEIFTWSFPITLPKQIAFAQVKRSDDIVPAIKEADSLYKVSVKNISLTFSRNDGRLVNIQNDKGSLPFNNGPVLQEGVNNFGSLKYHFDDKNLIIESSYDRKTNYNTLQWTIYPSGWIKMQVRYFPSAYFTDFDGVNFSFPEKEIKSVAYMGYGPYRVWKNRIKGNHFGIFNKKYNNTETGEAPFAYPEFKGYYSNLYWCRFVTTTQPLR